MLACSSALESPSSPPMPSTLVPAITTRPITSPTTSPTPTRATSPALIGCSSLGRSGNLSATSFLPVLGVRRHPPSARLEQHDRDLAVGPLRVLGEVGVQLDQAGPQLGALVGVGGARADPAYALLADPDGGVRMGDQVGVPLRVLREPALGRDDHEVGPVLEVEQRRREG